MLFRSLCLSFLSSIQIEYAGRLLARRPQPRCPPAPALSLVAPSVSAARRPHRPPATPAPSPSQASTGLDFGTGPSLEAAAAPQASVVASMYSVFGERKKGEGRGCWLLLLRRPRAQGMLAGRHWCRSNSKWMHTGSGAAIVKYSV